MLKVLFADCNKFMVEQDYSIIEEFVDGILKLTIIGKTDLRLGLELKKRVDPYRNGPTPALVLVDLRNVVIDLSILQIEDMLKMVLQAGSNRNQRVALLATPEEYAQNQKYNFLVNISNLLGFTLSIFTDSDVAIAWLRSKQK